MAKKCNCNDMTFLNYNHKFTLYSIYSCKSTDSAQSIIVNLVSFKFSVNNDSNMFHELVCDPCKFDKLWLA